LHYACFLGFNAFSEIDRKPAKIAQKRIPMKEPVAQQIVISGVGGQGVLFVTRVLALAAMEKGLSVLTSETHGMAQRGGTVVSHLKVGPFFSPLIRPAMADGLLVLQPENVATHGGYRKSGGWTVANAPEGTALPTCSDARCVDADGIAARLGVPRSANLVLLGAAAATLESDGGFFATGLDLQEALERWLAGKPTLLKRSQLALEAGIRNAPHPEHREL
jgi:indolepyruvate ferredoxin oxidoreductase beta subunit